MENSYSYEVEKILKNAESEMLELHHPYVGTEHLLLSLLSLDNIGKVVGKYRLTYESFKENLINIVGKSTKQSEVILYTPLLRIVLDDATIISKNEHVPLNEFHLLNALLTNDDGIAVRILMLMNVDIDGLFAEITNVKSKSLQSLGTVLNECDFEVLVGRDEEIKNIIEILLRKIKNNPLLIGGAGVGKSAIVHELARRIKIGEVPERLKKYKIISVDMASLLSNTKYRGEFETKLNGIIEEIKNQGNIILFIDEIHTIMKSGGGESSVDAANILKPYLASDDIKIIGATTISEYEHSIARDKALSRRFRIVNIEEPSLEETVHILSGVKGYYEDYHGINISEDNIADIVKLTDKYIKNNHNPDKSLDVLDYVCSRVSLSGYMSQNEQHFQEYIKSKDYKNALKVRKEIRKSMTKEITKDDIIGVIESICNIKMMTEEHYHYLCETLDKKIYGQDLGKLKKLLHRKVVDNKILGITLNGSEGVGKRYTAKTIAETMNYHYIELDGLEYTSPTSISRLVGSDPGYVGYEDDKLFDKIKYHPYTLLFIDHYPYMAQNIKHLMTSILKNGYAIDNRGERISFQNTMIIMATNITEKTIGYVEEKEQDMYRVEYQLIDKKCLVNCKEYAKVLDKAKEKTTFQEIESLIEESLYND